MVESFGASNIGMDVVDVKMVETSEVISLWIWS